MFIVLLSFGPLALSRRLSSSQYKFNKNKQHKELEPRNCELKGQILIFVVM